MTGAEVGTLFASIGALNDMKRSARVCLVSHVVPPSLSTSHRVYLRVQLKGLGLINMPCIWWSTFVRIQ